MSFLMKAKEKAQERIVESCLTAIMFLLAWLLSLVAPPIWSAISEDVPTQAILPILALSLIINLVLAYLVYLSNKKSKLQLRYGIYWDEDKNPYCPLCEKPTHYGDWHTHGSGYYCRPCDVVTPLQDSAGNLIKPEQVFGK